MYKAERNKIYKGFIVVKVKFNLDYNLSSCVIINQTTALNYNINLNLISHILSNVKVISTLKSSLTNFLNQIPNFIKNLLIKAATYLCEVSYLTDRILEYLNAACPLWGLMLIDVCEPIALLVLFSGQISCTAHKIFNSLTASSLLLTFVKLKISST